MGKVYPRIISCKFQEGHTDASRAVHAAMEAASRADVAPEPLLRALEELEMLLEDELTPQGRFARGAYSEGLVIEAMDKVATVWGEVSK